MSWALAVSVAAIVTAGVFLTLSRHLMRMVIGVSLLGAATNLAILAMARPSGAAPPVMLPTHDTLIASVDPLPQALLLTAVVIGFSLVCFSLILVLTIKQRTRSADGDTLRKSEPRHGRDGKPLLEERE